MLELLEWLGRVGGPESCDVGLEAVLLNLSADYVSTGPILSGIAILPPLEAGMVVLVRIPAVGWGTSKQHVEVGDLLRQGRFEIGEVGLKILC